MRTIGVAILGVFAGLLAGLLVENLVGQFAVAGGTISAPVAAVLGLALPVGGIVGAVAAFSIDARLRSREGGS